LNLGISSWWLGNVEEAESYLSKVLALKDSLGQENKQKADNKASIDLPTDKRAEILDNLAKFTGPALNYLGQIMREKGDFDQAESYYRQALDQNPEDITAIRNLGILLDLYRGQFADALPLYEQYQSLLDEPDPQVKDWIFDIKNRQ
jgi:tetratricopeptide (TPR) repeat protein